ncbi:glycoside hydrolase family 2 protein [Massilia horti]|uniref:glycoside hydrolase family 2 protein n=1 Tax=Massilia horti TaxID=2562153 RepID=UPI0014307BF6|nr:sugar-binding domain-containing protein [Massilia horti]
MKRTYAVLLSLFFSLAYSAAWAGARAITDFNPGWKFIKADPAGAEAPQFDDAKWTTVSAPHTFNDIDTFDNWSLPGHRGEQQQWSGRTWYRKTFTAPSAWNGKKVFIEFEAVRQVAQVYLNGVKLGVAKGGFTPFGFDLTPHLKIGRRNILAVMADNRFAKDPLDPHAAPQAATTAASHPVLGELTKQQMASIPDTLEELQADQIPWNNPHWHPAHGGIYRNVRLIVTDPLHITLPLFSFLQTEGPYVYADAIKEESAQIHFEVPLANGRAHAEAVTVAAEVFDAAGASVLRVTGEAGRIAPGASKTVSLSGQLAHPRLWEPAYPHLYRVALTLTVNGKVIDGADVPLGIRVIRWDRNTGLWVNGIHTRLHGWGQKPTNEWPGLGAALPDWMHDYTMQMMKDAGGNFIRWGHVPGGPAQIAAGDRLGLIADQPGGDGESDTRGGAWELRLANFRDVLIYYRNSPSIFIWEGGNQKVSREHAAALRALMDQYDPHGGRAYAHRRADAVTAEFMDVGIGTEGGREIARLPVVEGEYNREESPRRVWDDQSPPNFGYPEAKGQAYQLTSEQFAVNQVQHYVGKLGAPDHAGGANWLFSDSTSGGRVAVEVARAGGEVDGVRLPKEAYYVCQVMYDAAPRVHVIGHWSYPAGTKKTVYVVANTGGEVELFVNGRSLGRAQPENGFLYRFVDVAFEPGHISAVAYDKTGKQSARADKQTAGPAAALKLTPITGPGGWRADGADIVLFDVEAVDAQGRRVPTFQQRVDFALTGEGVWRGGYNSGKIDSINHLYLDLESGINRVAVRSTGKPGQITLRVSGQGLQPGTATARSHAASGMRPAVAPALPVTSVPHPGLDFVPSAGDTAPIQAGFAGRFIKTFSYAGPRGYIVHVETDARAGRNAYVDGDSALPDLPPQMAGADWVQAANADAQARLTDLVTLTVGADSTVFVAHDNRVPPPAWLRHDFKPTTMQLTVRGQVMAVYARNAGIESVIRLGANAEDVTNKDANMYLVFVQKR